MTKCSISLLCNLPGIISLLTKSSHSQFCSKCIVHDVCVYVYVYVCVGGGGGWVAVFSQMCVAVWCSGLCSRFPIETLRVRSPPSTVSHVFRLLLYLRVVTKSQMCMSEYMWWKKKKKKKKKGIVTGQNQPPRAVWCNTRLLNSGGQFDQTCNLFGGAIPAQGLC